MLWCTLGMLRCHLVSPGVLEDQELSDADEGMLCQLVGWQAFVLTVLRIE